jgi:hypothetical protein
VSRIPSRTLYLGLLIALLVPPAALAQDSGFPSSPAPATSPPPLSSPPDSRSYSGLPNSPARFGLGLGVGNMLTGVTAKLWAASTVAFQGALGEGADGNDLRVHLDLLFTPGTWTSSDGQYIVPVYLGIGGAFGHTFAAGQSLSYTEGGFRLPLGMSVLVRGNPIELFFEIAPEFTVRSNSTLFGKYGIYADGSIGARYYF